MELLTFIAVIFGIILAIITILLPFFIVGIYNRACKIDETLAKMAHMMKYGK